MGWRFRRSVTLFKGVKLNFSKGGTSLTLGGRGHSVTFSKNGTYANVGLPGTGISYREKIAGGSSAKKTTRKSSSSRASRSTCPSASGVYNSHFSGGGSYGAYDACGFSLFPEDKRYQSPTKVEWLSCLTLVIMTIVFIIVIVVKFS